MKPADSLKRLVELEKQLKIAKQAKVKVGVMASKVGGAIYGDGMTILGIAAIHEYGLGHNPQRSFLRTPFIINNKEIKAFIGKQFDRVMSGKSNTDRAMHFIGIYATNLSKASFRNDGYGQWQDIQQATKNAKGSDRILLDTGTLRNSITYEVKL